MKNNYSYLPERTPFLINAARVLQMSHCSLNFGNQSNVLYISIFVNGGIYLKNIV